MAGYSLDMVLSMRSVISSLKQKRILAAQVHKSGLAPQEYLAKYQRDPDPVSVPLIYKKIRLMLQIK